MPGSEHGAAVGISEAGRSKLSDLLLGRPLRSDEERAERLSNPVALAILSSDALSSVAYATEEMLKVLVPVAGIAAFSYVPPISAVIILLLLTLVFSYRQTIRAYPSAGGAYVVTRDNFGITIAQFAGVALLLDYIMTVAVSTSAGVAAIYSAMANLEFDEHPRGILGAVARAVDHLGRRHPDHLVAIVIPDALENRHATGRSVDKLRRSLRGRRAIVIDLRVDTLRGALLDPAPPRHAVLVPVNRADITTRDALAVAHLIGGHELHVVHFDRDDEETRDLEQKWDREQFHSELEIVAAPDRILGDALGWELDDLRRHGVRLVTVVIPELIPRWWQQPLYSRDTKHLLRVLRHEHDVAITTVPHPL